MKKAAFIITCFGCITLSNVLYVSAEELSSESISTNAEKDSSVKDSSLTKTSNSDSSALSTNATEMSSDDAVPTLRQSILSAIPYYGLSEEMVNRLSDEQLQHAKDMSFHFLVQDIGPTIKMIVKIYGDKPIPEESYSIDYSALSTDELKNYLPQLRLSLIYVYDLDKKIIDSLSDQDLIAMIDTIKIEFNSGDFAYMNAHGEYAVEAMATKIRSGDYNSNSSDSSTDSDIPKETSTTDTTKTNDSTNNTNKKKTLPSTGEKRNNSLGIIGISIITLLIITVSIRKRTKHF